jgi:hypothetical protein
MRHLPKTRAKNSRWAPLAVWAIVAILWSGLPIAAFAQTSQSPQPSNTETPSSKDVDQPAPSDNPPNQTLDQQPEINVNKYKSSLIMLSLARYGDTPGGLTCEAIDYVKRECEGKHRCVVRASPTVCTDTPPQVLIPYLFVQYRCYKTDKVRFQKIARPFMLRLTCETPIKPES